MNKSPIVRPVTIADLPAWRTLWASDSAFYGRRGQTALAEEITQTTWSGFFDTLEPVHALVAEEDGRLLRLTHYLFHRSTIHLGLNCHLQDLFTIETARGKSVGRAWIEAVCGRAKEAVSARVYWQTHETNVIAMRLYDQVARRSGFLVYSQLV